MKIPNNAYSHKALAISALCFITVTGTRVLAIEDYIGTPAPVAPAPGPFIPTFSQVTGKEYSDFRNITTAVPFSPPGAEDPGQVILWDGGVSPVTGAGGVADGPDFLPGLEPGGSYNTSQHIDALAAFNDALYNSVIANGSALLFSNTGDMTGTLPLLTESAAGTIAPWATDSEINGHDGVPPDSIVELDGIEVWGPDAAPDTDKISFFGDTSGDSVLNADLSPYIAQSTIAGSIGLALDDEVDLDALMVSDVNGLTTTFDVGDSILFSIRPFGAFDGGEIWILTAGAGPATFLLHGGHLWDTAFDVSTALGGGVSENIDGLEAISVPEPSTILFLTAAAGYVVLLRVRRRTA